MARTVPADRVERLLAAAAAAFVAHGYERAQMDDVAERLGVSKGTVYRSVDSKDALLVAVLDFADDPAAAPVGALLDDRDIVGAAGRLRARLRDRVAASGFAATSGRTQSIADPAAFADEVLAITRELFEVLCSYRVGIMVLDRCAPELPDVAAEWFGSGRYALVDAWSAYLDRHATMITGEVPVEVLARSITELVTTWAVKMPWDPAPRPLPSDVAAVCAAMVRNLVIGGPR
jgi:AcrR family transcriptional regulator